MTRPIFPSYTPDFLYPFHNQASKAEMAMQAAAKLQPKKVAAGERLLPGTKQQQAAKGEAETAAAGSSGSGAMARARGGYLPSGEWLTNGISASEDGLDSAESASAAQATDVFGIAHEKTVAMTRTIWTQVCLARHSPFLTGEEHRAIREMTEARRSRTALVTSRQLRLLLSAIEQLIPSEAMDNPPPPPLPPSGDARAPPFILEENQLLPMSTPATGSL